MENNFLLTDDLLWDYADGLLSPEEKQQVDAYLRQHPEWQDRLDAVSSERSRLFGLSLEQPDAGFAERVILAWTAEQSAVHATPPPKRDWRVYGIVLAFVVAIMAPVVLLVLSAGQLPVVQSPISFQNMPTSVEMANALASPVLRYAFYLLLAFSLLRLADRYLHQRRVIDQLRTQ